MSVIVEVGNRRLLVSKGAPESILGVSTSVGNELTNHPISQITADVNALIEKYKQAGNRLIALSIKTIEKKLDYSVADESGLIFVGLLVLSDPPKEDAGPYLSIEIFGNKAENS